MTTTTPTTNKPATVIRDGALKATAWRNESEKGSFYSVTFSRTYTDAEGKYRDSDRFSGSELLRLALLAQRIYLAVAELRYADGEAEESITE